MRLVPGLLAVAVMLSAGGAHALTTDELVQKNLDARGGAARLKAIKSVRYTQKGRFGGGVEADVVQLVERGGGVRNEFKLQGMLGIEGYDGRDGWHITPWQGRKDAERYSADDAKSLVEQADLEGPLVDWKAKGHKVEYLGVEDVDGTPAHKLKLTRATGDFTYYFLDPDYFLEIRTEEHQFVRGQENVTESDFGEYEQVAGIFVPYSVATGPKGATDKATFSMEKVEFDVPVDDALFKFPAPPAQPK